MRDTTMEHRAKELEILLAEMRDHPDRDHTERRERVQVLSKMLANAATATG